MTFLSMIGVVWRRLFVHEHLHIHEEHLYPHRPLKYEDWEDVVVNGL